MNDKQCYIHIEDAVIPQLITSSMEAYQHHELDTFGRKKRDKRLETFGLLWGYSIEFRAEVPYKIIVTMMTIETSAVRHRDWVRPSTNSINDKIEFMREYWPNIELVETFHSHPYKDLDEVKHVKNGWDASESDIEFFNYFHKTYDIEQPAMAHIIVTLAKLQKRGWAFPDRLQGSNAESGYGLSIGDMKVWMKSYATFNEYSAEDEEGIVILGPTDDVYLDIPSLQRKFSPFRNM